MTGDHSSTLVIGSSSGIGLACVHQLLLTTPPERIYCTTRSSNQNSVLISIGIPPSNIFSLDLTSTDSINHFLRTLFSRVSTLDSLICAAGYLQVAPALASTPDLINTHLQINCLSYVFLLQKIIPRYFLKHGGSIVGISSSAVTNSNSGRMAYSMSKSSFETAPLTIASEFGRRKVRANIVRPGLTDTPLMRNSTDESYINSYPLINTLASLATPSEIASVICFLTSTLSSHVNQQILSVDGGLKVR